MQAATVTSTVTGTFGAVQSGTDPLLLSGSAYSVALTLDSNDTPVSTTANSATYNVAVTLTAGIVTGAHCPNATATITNNASGDDLLVLKNCTVLIVTFTATVALPTGVITSTSPNGFPLTPIDATNSSATYASSALGTTKLGLTGSASATGPPSPTLSATPTSLTFSGAQNGSAPPSQNVALASSGAFVTYTAAVSTTSGGTWLSVAPTTGNTPSTLVVSVNQGTLAPGTYNGLITLTGPKASNTPITVPVTLTVTSVSLPNLILSPTTLTFSATQNGTPPATQPVAVSSSGAVINYTDSASTTSGGNWLSVTPSSGATPSNLTVSVNQGTLAAGTYHGSITVSSAGAGNSPQTVAVTLTVSALPTLALSPSSLSFNFTQGGSTPASQPVSATSSPSPVSFTAAATTNTGGNWLTVSPTSGTTPATLTVSVVPGSLAPGTYTGTVTVTSSGASNSPQTVSVTLTVTGAFTVSPSSLAFSYTLLGTVPAAQPISLGSAGTPLSFTAAATTNSGGNWLAVTPTTGTTPATLSVSVTPTSLAAGTYTGSITITSAQAPTKVVGVTLIVSSAATLSVSPATLSFTMQNLGSLPGAQNVSVTSSAPLSFTASATTNSGGNWLAVSPTSGSTPATLSVSIAANSLAAGTYTGTITVASAQASNSPQTVSVTLTVTPAPTISANPTTLTFTMQKGGSLPLAENVSVTSSSGSVSFTATAATNSGGSWLVVSPTSGSTTANLSVSIAANSLAPGTYTGTITVASTQVSNSPQTVSVTLTITAAPVLSVAPTSLAFAFQIGGTPPATQNLAVSSNGFPLNFTAAAATTTGGNWLSVAPTSGTTPATLAVTATPGSLAAGTYSGTITVTGSNSSNGPVVVAVTFTVSNQPVLSTAPSALTFTAQVNGFATAQMLSVMSSGGAVSFTDAASTTSGGNWLSVTPLSGTTTASLSVSVNLASLAAGTYNGAITVTSASASNSPLVVPVTLIVTSLPTLSASPTALAFTVQSGGVNPPAQNIAVGSSGPVVNFTDMATTASGGNWLSATPASGSTPGSLSVSVNGSALAVGTYSGTISIMSTQVSNSPITVAVTLTVTAAPSLAASPSSLTFTTPLGGPNPGSQIVSVTSNGNPLNFTAAAATASGGNWLSVIPTSGVTPGSLTVSVNATGLAVGSYSGTITIASAQASNSPVTVGITLTITTGPALTVSPSSLAFAFQLNGTNPASQVLTVGSSGAPLNFTASAATTTGGNWLSVSPGSGTTPGLLTVAVNAASLAAGTYNGTITIASAQASNSRVTVAVTLTVTNTPPATLTVAPTALTFMFQTNGVTPPGQTVSVTSNNGPLNFTAVAATATGGPWLSVTPASGATPASLMVSVNPAGLAVGTYTGTITVSSPPAASATVNVTLTVTGPNTITAAPSSLSFTFNSSVGPPAAQTVSIGGGGFPFTAAASTSTGGNWLSVTPVSGTAPATLNVSVNAGALAAGTYSGVITVTASGATNSPFTIPVTLTVTTPSVTFVTSSASFAFTVAAGGTPPPSQTISLSTSDNLQHTFTVAPDTFASRWLSVTPSSGATPSELTVSINPSGVPAGTYQSFVSLTGNGVTPVTIPVTLTVTSGTSISVSPASLMFAYQTGAAVPAAQIISVTSTGTPLSFSAATFGGAWLSATTTLQTTPGSITVTVNPANLAVGTYNGSIAISASSANGFNSAVTVPVTLVVTPGLGAITLAATPNALQFNTQSSTVVPPAQTISVTSAGGPADITAVANGGAWLSVVLSSAVTPSVITVSANPAGLASGTYNGNITLTSGVAANSPVVIPVELTVANATGLITTPTSLSFSYQLGGTVPANQTLDVTSTATTSFNVATGGGSWLVVTPQSGATPATLTVSIDPDGLANGDYIGSILLTPVGNTGGYLSVPVMLSVTQAAAGQPPVINGIVNAASGQLTYAPGLIVSIYGEGLGPQTGMPLTLTPDGFVNTTLGGTQVLFDGTAAPLVYVSDTQINTIIPYEVANNPTTSVQVVYNGVSSAASSLSLTPAAPGLFTLTQTGTGQGAILNQDLSVNGSSNSAASGSIIVLFGTGGGQTNPAAVDGSINVGDTTTFVQPVAVTVGGMPAQVLYEGPAPDLVSGALQINAKMPSNAGTGNLPVVVTIGGFTSQTGVTVSVK